MSRMREFTDEELGEIADALLAAGGPAALRLGFETATELDARRRAGRACVEPLGHRLIASPCWCGQSDAAHGRGGL